MASFHKRYLDEPGHVKEQESAESNNHYACQPKECLRVKETMGSDEVIIFIAPREKQ
jgi:hypothetical protein